MPPFEDRDRENDSGLDALGLERLRGQGTAFKLALAGLAIAFGSVFLPWVSSNGIGFEQAGFSTFEGRWILAATVVCGFLLFRYAQDYEPLKLVGAGIAALIVFLGAASVFVTTEFLNDSPFEQALGDRVDGNLTNFGLWICVFGGGLSFAGIGMMIGDVVSPPTRRDEEPTREPDGDRDAGEDETKPLPPPE